MQSEWRRLGPAHWSALTHKRVVVHADNGHELRGFVVTVDPVSASLVLLDLEGPAEVRLVLGHAVKQVQVLDPDPSPDQKKRLDSLFMEPDAGLDPDLDLDRTRDQLQDWLRLNLVPVETQGAELKVAGVVTVTAPYRDQDCVSPNQTVLDRVQRLIRNQPRVLDQD